MHKESKRTEVGINEGDELVGLETGDDLAELSGESGRTDAGTEFGSSLIFTVDLNTL